MGLDRRLIGSKGRSSRYLRSTITLAYSAAHPFGRAKDAVALLILRMILSENRYRFSGSCARHNEG
ncbi:hypothetical protein BQ8794_140096 [Mesorhizobium prunaredense]|uniref:Uncharacterized protein n=1 Tax=Mesorhizobium prunaredense TaxID=1631249 RepID=A0A1R3V243_9HYPH|nr:hypothetical protein BQ8794_140096 [Mesorhizobium prunaredense]